MRPLSRSCDPLVSNSCSEERGEGEGEGEGEEGGRREGGGREGEKAIFLYKMDIPQPLTTPESVFVFKLSLIFG